MTASFRPRSDLVTGGLMATLAALGFFLDESPWIPSGSMVAAGICAIGKADEPIGPGDPSGAGPVSAAAKSTPPADTSDIARKAEIMNSPRWRRAIFELGEWLATQHIYTAEQVRRIKADFNQRVAAMSSYELEYLLDDLDAKFKILDTPEARDARAWVGQYLSVMSDQKRAKVLRDVPDVVTMSAAQLQQELLAVEQMRSAAGQRQADFESRRDLLVRQAQQNRQATATAASAAMARASAGPSFSPYRSGGHQGKPPFSGTKSGPGISMAVFSGNVGIGVGSL